MLPSSVMWVGFAGVMNPAAPTLVLQLQALPCNWWPAGWGHTSWGVEGRHQQSPSILDRESAPIAQWDVFTWEGRKASPSVRGGESKLNSEGRMWVTHWSPARRYHQSPQSLPEVKSLVFAGVRNWPLRPCQRNTKSGREALQTWFGTFFLLEFWGDCSGWGWGCCSSRCKITVVALH